jgi:hypothetical protein
VDQTKECSGIWAKLTFPFLIASTANGEPAAYISADHPFFDIHLVSDGGRPRREYGVAKQH